MHCWPFTSSFLLLLSFLPLIVPVVLYFPLPVSYSSFSQQFLLAILPPALLLSLPPHPPAAAPTPPPPMYIQDSQPISIRAVFLFFFTLFSHTSLFYSFPILSVFLCVFNPSAFYANLFSCLHPFSLPPLHLSFLYFSTSSFFFFLVSLFLSPPHFSPFIIAS